MNVLIFSKFKPYPPTAGGLVRMWTLAKSLKSEGVEVKFVVPVFRSSRVAKYEGIPIYEIRLSIAYVVIAFFLRKVLPSRIGRLFHYLFMITYFEKNLEKKLEIISKNCDIIQCEFAWLYRIPYYVSKRRNLPFILTFHDINSDFLLNYLKPKDLLSRYLIRKVRKAEIAAYNASDALVCFTQQDFEELVTMGIPQGKIRVVPHGIAKVSINPTFSTVRPIVIFVGSGHPPNITSAELIINKIAPKVPEADFFIVGNVGDSIKHFKKPNNVILTGFLSEKELLNLYNKAALAIVPLLSGAGMSVKTIEFLSAGLPVLATSIGARGLTTDSSKSEALIVNDYLSEYPELIKKLVKNLDLRKNCSERAKLTFSCSLSEMSREYLLLYNRFAKKSKAQ